MKKMLILLSIVISQSLFAQDTLKFNIKLLKDTIFAFEPFEIYAKIENISNQPVRIVLPWNEGNNNCTNGKPLLYIRRINNIIEQKIKNSDLIKYVFCHDLTSYDWNWSKITSNTSRDKNLLYSTYTCDKIKLAQRDSSLYKLIFPKSGHYKLRLSFYNQEYGSFGYQSEYNKTTATELIYSNEVDIFIKKIPKREKKAIAWLKKQKNCLSLIYEPSIRDPLVQEKGFKISQLQQFIALFPKSMFIPYAKVQLADKLMSDYTKNKTIESYNEILALIDFSTQDKKILEAQKEIQRTCKYYQNTILNQTKK